MAQPQYLATHVTHSDARCPVADEQSAVLRLAQHLVEQHGPFALVLYTVVGLQLDNKELRGMGVQVALHLVDGLFESHVDLADAVSQAQYLLLFRVFLQGINAHHGAQVEEANAALHLLLEGSYLADGSNVENIVQHWLIESHASHGVVGAGYAQLAHLGGVFHHAQPVGDGSGKFVRIGNAVLIAFREDER